MTGRDWQPGDVLVSNGERGIVWGESDGRLYVEMASGKCHLLDELADARPLAAIDYEDPEQAERLARLFWSHGTDDSSDVDAMQAALREFADPKPRIEEPQGLGAVVEDADGRRWLRVIPGGGGYGPAAWTRPVSAAGPWRQFREIDVAKVLSEGIQS